MARQEESISLSTDKMRVDGTIVLKIWQATNVKDILTLTQICNKHLVEVPQ